MNETKVVRGYKAFNSDWTCREKQYTCPGKFEENVKLDVCRKGMHFCKKLSDCFQYYKFSPSTKIAEVIAYGLIIEEDGKCCTDKLEIVREIPWHEVLEIVNVGRECTGNCNSGNWNSGNWNSGNCNSGNCNSGNWNSGNCNSGNWNSGEWNSGDYNSGSCNSGNWNSGGCNSGDRNSGEWNSGDYNSGNWNSGDYNSGNHNSGDWNRTSFSNGCFNTAEPKIYLFNKPSKWTYSDWLNSEARLILSRVPTAKLEYVYFEEMTDDEKREYSYAKITGGYLKEVRPTRKATEWWKSLDETQKMVILSLPNFDKAIFKEITGIDIDG